MIVNAGCNRSRECWNCSHYTLIHSEQRHLCWFASLVYFLYMNQIHRIPVVYIFGDLTYCCYEILNFLCFKLICCLFWWYWSSRQLCNLSSLPLLLLIGLLSWCLWQRTCYIDHECNVLDFIFGICKQLNILWCTVTVMRWCKTGQDHAHLWRSVVHLQRYCSTAQMSIFRWLLSLLAVDFLRILNYVWLDTCITFWLFVILQDRQTPV